MSELREAAQAIVDELEDWISNGLIADLRAALAQPETEAEPVAWMYTFHEVTRLALAADAGPYIRAHGAPLYAHPPRDEWREASEPTEGEP